MLVLLFTSLKKGLHPDKFPAFAAKMVLLTNILEPLLLVMFNKLGVSGKTSIAASTLGATFVACLSTFPTFQNHVGKHGRHISLDLTLLMFTRAMDTAFATALGYKSSFLGSSSSSLADGALFAVSSCLIMYNWVYNPENLPPAYRRWVAAAANLDLEIVDTLRYIKEKKLFYGVEGRHLDTLAGYCRKYGQDPLRGCTTTNIPLQCEVVHAFQTKNCELHALWRFARGFTFAFRLYGPLNALMLLVPKSSPWKTRIFAAIVSSVRSSCFLGAFIGFFWYGACLGRTRALPKLFPGVPASRWDDGVCVATGSAACGLSGFIETAQRRKELALFVAPRALGTMISAEPTQRNLRIERLVLALSTAVLVTSCKQDSSRVRGVFGRGLQAVFMKRF